MLVAINHKIRHKAIIMDSDDNKNTTDSQGDIEESVDTHNSDRLSKAVDRAIITRTHDSYHTSIMTNTQIMWDVHTSIMTHRL